MDIKEALIYPYRKGHFWYSVGIPTLIYLGVTLWMCLAIFVPMMIAAASGMLPKPGESSVFAPILIVSFLIAFIPMLPICFVLYGYYWTMLANWQTHGLDAPPPGWKGQWKAYFVDGAHCFLVFLLMYIPMILGYLTLGFLLPFVMAPFYESAQERRIGAFWRSIPQSFEQARAQYWPLLGGMWMCLLLYIPFFVVYFLTSATFVAPMLLVMAFGVSLLRLMTQQYGRFYSPQTAPVDAPEFS